MIEMPLNAHLHNMLLALEKAHSQGAEWVYSGDLAAIPHHTRQQAIKEELVEARGKTLDRAYKLTKQGLSILGENAGYYLEHMDKIDPESPVKPAKRVLAGTIKLCKIEGCGKPRHKKHTFCLDHQREVWRNNQKKQQPDQAVVISSQIRPIEVHREPAPEPEAINIPEPIQQAIDACGTECQNCTYKEALAIVARRYPSVLKLVEAIKELDRTP